MKDYLICTLNSVLFFCISQFACMQNGFLPGLNDHAAGSAQRIPFLRQHSAKNEEEAGPGARGVAQGQVRVQEGLGVRGMPSVNLGGVSVRQRQQGGNGSVARVPICPYSEIVQRFLGQAVKAARGQQGAYGGEQQLNGLIRMPGSTPHRLCGEITPYQQGNDRQNQQQEPPGERRLGVPAAVGRDRGWA